MKNNILIVEDHELTRFGLKTAFEACDFVGEIYEAESGEVSVDVVENNHIDLVIMDLGLPGMNGIEATRKIKQHKPEIKVIILTVHNEADYLMRAVEIGANGYVLKDSGSAELKKAIFAILDGESYIQPNLIPELNSYLIHKDDDKNKLDALTKREVEVLIEVAKGNFNKDIAMHLNISERTVKNHMVSIFKKIEVADRTQAAVFAIKNNLIKI